jgi:hypothetical protein
VRRLPPRHAASISLTKTRPSRTIAIGESGKAPDGAGGWSTSGATIDRHLLDSSRLLLDELARSYERDTGTSTSSKIRRLVDRR